MGCYKFHKFKVLDMKKIDPDEFLKSDKPEEVIRGDFSWEIQR
jgi:hypothetical protein